MKPNTNTKSPCQKALAPTNKGATFKDMITLRAVTREGATFGDDMIAFRAEFIGGGAKLFLSRRLFKWGYSCVECVEAVMMTVGAGITAHEALPVPLYGASHRKMAKSMAENAIFRSLFLEN